MSEWAKGERVYIDRGFDPTFGNRDGVVIESRSPVCNPGTVHVILEQSGVIVAVPEGHLHHGTKREVIHRLICEMYEAHCEGPVDHLLPRLFELEMTRDERRANFKGLGDPA